MYTYFGQQPGSIDVHEGPESMQLLPEGGGLLNGNPPLAHLRFS